MRIDLIRKIAGSVFTRLLAVSLAAGLCLDLLVFGAIHFYRERHLEGYEQILIGQYVDYLLADLGDPPDVQRARDIARRTTIVIAYRSGDRNWSTSDTVPQIPPAVRRAFQVRPGMRAGFYRGHHFARVTTRDGELTFIVPRHPGLKKEATLALLVLLGLMTAIMAGTYFYIRWVLKPLRWLKEGATAVGGGNLGHRVPEKRSDEFRDLAESFNKMTRRINDMLRGKEQLLLDISHELRSPVTRMKLELEFLPDSPIRESLREDICEVERMVTQILDAARLQKSAAELNLRPVDLAQLIPVATDPLAQRAPGIRIGSLPPLTAVVDPEKVLTVLSNVLENALKYASESTRPVEISLGPDDGSAIIKVRDFGIGIPKEAQPYLFEPFFRVDGSRSRETGGYGLGLSLCKTIMTAHGGRIDIDSEPEKGTTVTLVFPLPSQQSKGR